MNPYSNISQENPLILAIHTAVKGRARYKVNGLHHSESLKRYLELRLSQKQIITQVRANDLTGNVLVIFPSNVSPNAIALLLQDVVLDFKQKVRQLPVGKAQIVTGTEPVKNFPQTLIHKQLNKVSNQLIFVSGTVFSLVLATGLLHRYNLDTGILLAIQKLHTPLLDRIMVGITFLGDPLVLLLICLGLEINLLHDNRRREANTLGIAAVSAVGLNYLLKVLFGRVRPALWNRIINVGHHSFPSGHAMVSMVLYGFIGYILAKQFPQWQKQIFISTILLIVAIGFTRLYLGVHWPTDVIAGYAIGLVALMACILYLKGHREMRETRRITPDN
ncbi:phosphatase PAP2 family protein [Dendronalium sp. ChiSLP03b]|uniref:phosphatase PAP2 family protein n=1 Tax=Dendronalium sp. ChiSLP03b TaxID=3075381 RepID=UPI002AD28FE5|nr:phosphatase PAP2 family protein [Dendronalium sp. ChiSLP03b]MDZ8202902.1 phosphatase PAP2 family protein [Dendronalium sp. ChiSLP03b]